MLSYVACIWQWQYYSFSTPKCDAVKAKCGELFSFWFISGRVRGLWITSDLALLPLWQLSRSMASTTIHCFKFCTLSTICRRCLYFGLVIHQSKIRLWISCYGIAAPRYTENKMMQPLCARNLVWKHAPHETIYLHMLTMNRVRS